MGQIRGVESDTHGISTGVSQGFLLGPLLVITDTSRYTC